ncbi:hypothetical protein D1831_08615 [Lactiplantibacillus garii]|uniref:Uncharacterized protein n=1 Tax=Lactiplantibacillus garii TaxID=2306423 RepID=A0A3R8L0M2_9LACO|nr:hypothetical protein [Lactiplantibacillus garii]RRK10214.1 hypothetical protein D1831_08615 [Lactiplantibacillus garii]
MKNSSYISTPTVVKAHPARLSTSVARELAAVVNLFSLNWLDDYCERAGDPATRIAHDHLFSI